MAFLELYLVILHQKQCFCHRNLDQW